MTDIPFIYDDYESIKDDDYADSDTATPTKATEKLVAFLFFGHLGLHRISGSSNRRIGKNRKVGEFFFQIVF